MRARAVRQWLRLLAVAGGAVGLGACLRTATPGISQSSSNVPAGAASRAVQQVYVRPGVVQYFLLPQVLEGPAKQYVELDLVVRDSAQVPLYGLLHVSVVGSTAVRLPADTLLLSTSGQVLALTNTRVLFTEPKGAATLTRLEAYLTPAQTVAYLCGPTHAIMLGGTSRRRYQPAKKAAVALASLATQAGNCSR